LIKRNANTISKIISKPVVKEKRDQRVFHELNDIKKITLSQQAIAHNLTDVLCRLNEKQHLENALRNNK
jgi:hypothetical protein